jgi:hypothetical protein
MKKSIFILFLCGSFCLAQGSVGTGAGYEPRYLIDVPTAGIISHGVFAIDLEFFQLGGVLAGTTLGMFDFLTIGVHYGGINIIGNNSTVWNDLPGIDLRLRVINETVLLPAIAVGFNSQGKENYDKDKQRYTIKSLGFYAVGSKNYKLLGNFSVHGGANYSLERMDGDRDPNIFVGVEKSIGQSISFLAEYNLGWNDSHAGAFGRGRGYLNSGLRISVGAGFSIGLNMKDILKNQNEISVGNRTIFLEYLQQL